MPVCSSCGNDYDKAFTVTLHNGQQFAFDSIECAVQIIAPTCAQCGIRIIGHGLEAGGQFFCCDHCATRSGVEGLTDRVR